MTTIFCKCDGAALIPQSRAALVELFNLPREVSLKVVVTRPRNIKQHRLFFAFVTYVAEALNDGPAPSILPWTQERVVELLKLATGHVELAPLPPKDAKRLGVDLVARPKSISFASMDGAEFSKFMEAAFVYVRDELCHWIEDSPHWAEIQTILRESYLLGGQEAAE